MMNKKLLLIIAALLLFLSSCSRSTIVGVDLKIASLIPDQFRSDSADLPFTGPINLKLPSDTGLDINLPEIPDGAIDILNEFDLNVGLILS